MHAWKRAKEAYLRDNPPMAFEILLGTAVAAGGYVYSTPDLFIIAFPVYFDEYGRMVHSDDEGDTWFVHLAALSGEVRAASSHKRPTEAMKRFLNLAPYALPFVAWHRHGKPKVHRYTWNQLEARIADQLLHT
jgi:hypothetical protein